MLRVLLITVGSLPKGAFEEIAQEYKKYLAKYAKLEHRVVKTVDDLDARLPSNAVLVVLDAAGVRMTSEQFAEHVARWEDAGRTVAFVIGGAAGLPADVKHNADLLLSLSPMMTTHDLAHLFFLEQIFRALSIVHHSTYHK